MAANYEWIAEDVAGTADDLTGKLNDMERNGYEIFQVTAMLITNQHGWVVIGRKKPAETKPVEPTGSEHEPHRRGTVTLKPRR